MHTTNHRHIQKSRTKVSSFSCDIGLEVMSYLPGSGFSQPQNTGVPNYGSTFPTQQTAPQVIIIGGCPACHVSLGTKYTQNTITG